MRVFVALWLTVIQASPLVPLEGPTESEFASLPEQFEANPVFLVPRLQKPVSLPTEEAAPIPTSIASESHEPTSEPKPEAPSDCETGTVNVVTNQGKSHFVDYTCQTTAGEILKTMQTIALVSSDTTLNTDIFVSTKGFFHERTIDTLKSDDKLVNHNVHNNGMVFVTIACPVATVYFQFEDRFFPQVLNCSTTIQYVSHLFLRISGVFDVEPKFTFTSHEGVAHQITETTPILAQLKDITTKVVNVDYPARSASASASPLPSPSVSRSSSPPPVPISRDLPAGNWDAQDERNEIPPGAVPLGGGSLLQQAATRSEEMKKYRTVVH